MDEQGWSPQTWADVRRGITWFLAGRIRSGVVRRREILLWKIRTRLGYRRASRVRRVDLEVPISALLEMTFPLSDAVPRMPAVGSVHRWYPAQQETTEQ